MSSDAFDANISRILKLWMCSVSRRCQNTRACVVSVQLSIVVCSVAIQPIYVLLNIIVVVFC